MAFDEPAGPYVRLLWLLTRDLRATSPRSPPGVKRPVYHAHKHAATTTFASITVASVRFTLAASLRETAGDKWLTEIRALKREAFSKWLIIIID